MINTLLYKKSLDPVGAHRFLNKFRHAAFETSGCNHCIIISSEGDDVGFLNTFFADHLVDSLTCFEAVHHWHAAVHKDYLECIHIAVRLTSARDLLLQLV